MNMKDLEVFLAVYEYQNMTKAANILYLTPQSISNTINKLEAEFGVQLFTRIPNGSLPTHNAALLKTNAQKILNDFQDLSLTFSGTEVNKKTIKIGSIPGVFRYLSTDFIDSFYEQNPFFKLDIIEQHESIVEEACWNESIDIAIISCPINHLKFDANLLFSLKFCLVMNENHPLAAKDHISFSDLDNYPLAILRCFIPYIGSMQQNRCNPNIILKTSDMELLTDIAMRDSGIGVTIDFFAFQKPREHTVIRYFDDEKCTWNCYMLLKKNKKLNPEVIAFCDFVLEWQNNQEN